MSIINKIDSNITGLRYCENTSLGVLPAAASQIWKPLEPNSYKDFGASVKTVARNPINSSRQRKKGVVVDLDASGGINSDVTQTNMQDLLQGFVFADLRKKIEHTNVTAVTVATNKYTIATSTLRVGDLIFASGFTNAANNGLKRVTAVDATDVTVAEALSTEVPPTGHKLVQVGFQFAANDATMTQTGGNLPILGATAKNLTQFGLVPGEWIFIGGDTAITQYATAADNGFARVRSVTATQVTLDKTANTIVTDAGGGGKTIQIFFGRVLKNEQGTLVKRRAYDLERVLGYNNDADITKQQAEYLVGSIPNQLELAVPTADKVTIDLSFVSLRGQLIDENVSGPNTLKSKAAVAAGTAANAPGIVEADAFNTSSDVSRIKMSTVSQSVSNPTPLFAFVQELKLTIDNKVTANKAVGVTGAFEATAGTFEVGGSMTVYFADVAAVTAVQNNADITLDAHFVKTNAGITFDIPLLALGDGRPNVVQDQAITLPLENSAADGSKVSSTLNHTLLLVFWDYLPSLADV
jgi:hypothetical protein